MFQLHEVQSVSESVGIYYRVISPHWGNIKTCCLCYTYVCIQSRCSCWTLFVLKWKMLTERAIKEMNFYGVWAHVHLCVCCDILTHRHTHIHFAWLEQYKMMFIYILVRCPFSFFSSWMLINIIFYIQPTYMYTTAHRERTWQCQQEQIENCSL